MPLLHFFTSVCLIKFSVSLAKWKLFQLMLPLRLSVDLFPCPTLHILCFFAPTCLKGLWLSQHCGHFVQFLIFLFVLSTTSRELWVQWYFGVSLHSIFQFAFPSSLPHTPKSIFPFFSIGKKSSKVSPANLPSNASLLRGHNAMHRNFVLLCLHHLLSLLLWREAQIFLVWGVDFSRGWLQSQKIPWAVGWVGTSMGFRNLIWKTCAWQVRWLQSLCVFLDIELLIFTFSFWRKIHFRDVLWFLLLLYVLRKTFSKLSLSYLLFQGLCQC